MGTRMDIVLMGVVVVGRGVVGYLFSLQKSKNVWTLSPGTMSYSGLDTERYATSTVICKSNDR